MKITGWCSSAAHSLRLGSWLEAHIRPGRTIHTAGYEVAQLCHAPQLISDTPPGPAKLDFTTPHAHLQPARTQKFSTTDNLHSALPDTAGSVVTCSASMAVASG